MLKRLIMRVYNKRTNVDGREPSVNEMEHGEIAVNYNATNPRLIIKDSNNEIENFLPESNINGRMDNVNDTLSNLNEKVNENKDGIETIESWINTPITDDEITKLMIPPLNSISYQIVSPYAPGGVDENAPRILFTSDYPVVSELNITGKCLVTDAIGQTEYVNINATMLAGDDTTYDAIETTDIKMDVTFPYSISEVTETKIRPTCDTTYKYDILEQFYINNVVYYFKKGMTWSNWVNSEYNTDNYRIASSDNEYIFNSSLTHYVVDEKGVGITFPSQREIPIIKNYKYGLRENDAPF